MVWKLGDFAVVEWPVAKWRLCFIRGVPWSWLRWTHLEHCKIKNILKRQIQIFYPWKALKASMVNMASESFSWLLSASIQKDYIILYDVQKVFAIDALASSHPLSRKEEEVNTPAEISEMFNTISYNKVWFFRKWQHLHTCLEEWLTSLIKLW